MSVQLDTLIVPSHNRIASAQLLAEILGVEWERTVARLFSVVYLNGLTLRFVQTDEAYSSHHYRFRASLPEFAGVQERIIAAGLACRSEPDGIVELWDGELPGGGAIYWDAPDGHVWSLSPA